MSELEKIIGIEFFATKSKGIGGELRKRWEDFVVEEITPQKEILYALGPNSETSRLDGERGNGGETVGDYTIFTLERHGLYNTFEALDKIAHSLGVGIKRFSYAGVKDKRAVTTQRISVWRVDPERLKKLNIKGLYIRDVRRGAEAVKLGDLWGNHFRITVRGISLEKSEVELRVKQTCNEIEELGGVPNFFGYQRFGLRRPLSHLVGIKLAKNEFREAAMLFLAKAYPLEGGDAQEARNYLFETGDFAGALEKFPKRLTFERTMLKHLSQHPNDILGAFRRIQRGLLLMFIHAAQSYLFNRILSLRYKCGLPLNSAVVGDIVAPVQNASPRDHILVTEENVSKINEQIKSGTLGVAIPLIGYDTTLPMFKPGELVEKILQEEGLNPGMFRLPSIPEISSKGGYRLVLSKVSDLEVLDISEDEYSENAIKLTISFSLSKGSYATMVLREFMKTEPTRY
ncbi:MAG: tRNA pseudouridine(13) synthase TruD [Candidatus Jordarchaeaceae archaeon]